MSQKAEGVLREKFDTYVQDLEKLVRIPSVSFPGFPPDAVKKSAAAVAELLKLRGLEKVEILTVGSAHPYIYGEYLHAPGKPTVLLYAHHDVQPPGREEIWETPPFEPVIKAGPKGKRMYGRGSADDKAGIVVHTSAIDAFLRSGEPLPVNVKMVIEGEEEIGSGHLPEFLRTYRDRLDADILVLTDSTNFDSGVPALTVALRGMVALDIELRSLNKTVHSGMWGGPVPDPAMGLAKVLGTLVDAQGEIAVPGVLDDVRKMSDAEHAEMARIPFKESEFREQCGMLPGVEILKSAGIPSPLVQIWKRPSLTINAMQASSRAQAGNIINDAAWARVTLRLVADMDPARVIRQVKEHLRAHTPWGLELTVKHDGGVGAWATEPVGPAFAAARVAMKKGYGVEPYLIGCGGTIPFVKPFADALGGAPALLVGVEDPYTNAHGENESMLMSDFLASCLTEIHLFSELAEKFSPRAGRSQT